MKSLRHSTLKLAAVAAFAVGGIAPALAGTVGGSVAPINTLVDNYVSGITIVAGAGQTDTTVVSGTIDNNFDQGWKLTVTSGNTGKLKRGAGGAGRELLYSNVKLVKTGGTLGAGLTDPANGATGVAKDVISAPAVFNTGTAPGTPGTATSATVAYAYALKITWSADTSLLSGTYSDTITLVLANDS